MQRHLFGAAALALWIAAAVIWFWWPGSESTLSFCYRMGAVLTAAWLAYDDIQRLPTWLLLLLPVLLVALVRWSRLLLLLIPALLAWAVLQRLIRPTSPPRRR